MEKRPISLWEWLGLIGIKVAYFAKTLFWLLVYCIVIELIFIGLVYISCN